MAKTSKSIFLFSFLSIFIVSNAQTCKNYTFMSNRNFNSCIDLPYHDAHLHWNYFPSNNKVAIAYRATQVLTGWVAWAINPTQLGMVGSQALVAFHNSNGTMVAYPTAISTYSPSMQPGDLSFQVSNISAEYAKNEMIMFAVIGPLNGTRVNQVWQAGNSLSNDVPQMHMLNQPNLQSFAELDFLSG